jgi:ADP-heptose:LPS heptosyltransferase
VSRVLAIKVHDQLGDFLLATPALHVLRRRYSAALIALVTREYLAPLASRNPDVDHVWALPRVRGPKQWVELARLFAGVRRFRPDLVVVLNSVSRSKTADALALLSAGRVIVGRSAVGAGELPANAPESPLERARRDEMTQDPIYDLDLPFARTSEHQVERYLDLVRWTAGAVPEANQRDGASPRLKLASRERLEGQRALRSLDSPRVGLHPGAANPLKCWPIASFLELGIALARESRASIVVFDSPREVGRAAMLRASLEAQGVAAALIPPGGIGRFMALCAALDLLVCNDSGVAHIAAALGVPTLSLHSLGRPREWAPRGARAVALHAPSIQEISVAEAVDAARALLEGANGAKLADRDPA